MPEDDRGYHLPDKGERARVIYNPHDLVTPLAVWCTRYRSDPAVIRLRLQRARAEVVQRERAMRDCLATGDLFGATLALWMAVHWLRAGILEGWGERDVATSRWGARFERLAAQHGRPELAEMLNELSGLDDAAVEQRMADAPESVVERHAWSWRTRRQIGEPGDRLQDARDTLRSTWRAETLTVTPPYPAWLDVPTEPGPLEERVEHLAGCWARIDAAWDR